MKDNDEKALIALLAKKLHPDAQEDLSRPEIEELLAKGEDITEAERAVFKAIDPLALIRGQGAGPVVIPFPAQQEYEDLPMAAGFYRGGESKDADPGTRESVNKKRAEIRKRLQKERDESGDSTEDD